MNINHYLVDENTFVVITDKNEEITYKTINNITDLDAFSFVFVNNELEYRGNKLNKLYEDKKELRKNLYNLKKYLNNAEKINKKIKETKKDISILNNRLDMIYDDINISSVSIKKRVLNKNNK